MAILSHTGILRAMKPGLVAVIGLAIWGSAAPAVWGQDEGVVVDPDSPAGKEYAIPLDQARRDSSGGTSARGDGGGSASAPGGQPLFGSGISPRGGRAEQARDQASTADTQGRRSAPATTSTVLATAAEKGGDSSRLVLGAVVVGILLLGAILGLGLRRWQRPAP